MPSNYHESESKKSSSAETQQLQDISYLRQGHYADNNKKMILMHWSVHPWQVAEAERDSI